MNPHSLAIHIFRRDLRLEDNSALNTALEKSELVLPIFIFDDRQLDHPFRGDNSFQFMIASLQELNQELITKGSRLHFFKGNPAVVLHDLHKQLDFDAVYFNRDYTPFSRKRDAELSETCTALNVQLNIHADALLTEPEQVHKDDGAPYTVYTPFMKKARLNTIPKPEKRKANKFYPENIELQFGIDKPELLLRKRNPHLLLNGGRKEGLKLLNKIKEIENYEEERNFPSVKATSLLSAHHKFGTISIRESYWEIAENFNKSHTLINELYWRDFFTHIVWHFPKVLGQSFREKYENIPWENDQATFEKWCRGETGFPIVDAGMHELTTTGYMHNRVRMIVASFLTKDLHIDWRWGERFFAQHLIDYDPAVNNGNWQWAASTGCDAQPYFRIFNPWSQQKKFDPHCNYIKKWVPELAALNAAKIHKLENTNRPPVGYPEKIVDHKEKTTTIKGYFKNA